jgi:hypothetical protein
MYVFVKRFDRAGSMYKNDPRGYPLELLRGLAG